MPKSTDSRHKVLVVEDEPYLAKLLSEKLDKSGFEVIVTHNGKDGLDSALRQHPDIILLDVLMPVMDGITMLKELRMDKSWGVEVPVIVLSNLSDTKHVLESLQGGALDYLVKSDLDLDTVVKQIHFRLGTSRHE